MIVFAGGSRKLKKHETVKLHIDKNTKWKYIIVSENIIERIS